MPGTTEIELAFGDGDYLFSLKLPQIAELQRLRDTGILAIYSRIMRGRAMFNGEALALPQEGQAFAEDCYETIRLALIGGGKGVVNGEEVTVNQLRARQLVETYAHPPVPLKEAWNTAAAILFALIEGYEAKPAKPEPQKKSPQRKGRTASK